MRQVDKQIYELFCLREEQAGNCCASFDESTGTEWRMDRSDTPIAYAQWKGGRATYYISDGSFK